MRLSTILVASCVLAGVACPAATAEKDKARPAVYKFEKMDAGLIKVGGKAFLTVDWTPGKAVLGRESINVDVPKVPDPNALAKAAAAEFDKIAKVKAAFTIEAKDNMVILTPKDGIKVLGAGGGTFKPEKGVVQLKTSGAVDPLIGEASWAITESAAPSPDAGTFMIGVEGKQFITPTVDVTGQAKSPNRVLNDLLTLLAPDYGSRASLSTSGVLRVTGVRTGDPLDPLSFDVGATYYSTDADLEGSFSMIVTSGVCTADCNNDGVLDIRDFSCFQNQFSLRTAYADCNADGFLDVRDFSCFQNQFALACP